MWNVGRDRGGLQSPRKKSIVLYDVVHLHGEVNSVSVRVLGEELRDGVLANDAPCDLVGIWRHAALVSAELLHLAETLEERENTERTL